MPAKRNYKEEYAKYQSSPERRKYRAELNKEARDRGIYGKRKKMGKDLVHKNGKIAGLGSASANKADGARKATRARMRNKKK